MTCPNKPINSNESILKSKLSTSKLLLTLLSIATLLIYPNKAQFIQDYALSTGVYDTDCELYSGSVTIISCPKTDTYDVFLTEMLTNTTIAEIQNEIKG